ncbi:DUF2844 domain-containing protein [Variovorax sp. E3]|uniref:DUF2844 domain-containing protein n=1 Tax=Variovorax sp. E3 TaxID=1914993 RepID=UPI0018DC5681|nr:DUF2844 domain-containing protein [Variovorax sp. E3]
MSRESQQCHARHAPATALPGRLGLGLALAVAALLATPSAFAELGGAPTLSPAQAVNAVGAESRKAAAPAGNAAASGATNWSVREITLPDGLVEREYLTTDGVVFAVAWRGTHRPELSVLLGTHYATQMSQNARALRQQGKGSRATTAQADATFAVQASTHQRSSTGVAWLPALLPAGVDPATLSIPQGS